MMLKMMICSDATNDDDDGGDVDDNGFDLM